MSYLDRTQKVPGALAERLHTSIQRYRNSWSRYKRPEDLRQLLRTFPSVTLTDGYFLDYIPMGGPKSSWIWPFAKPVMFEDKEYLPEGFEGLARDQLMSMRGTPDGVQIAKETLYKYFRYPSTQLGIFEYAIFIMELWATKSESKAREWLTLKPLFSRHSFDNLVLKAQAAKRIRRPEVYEPTVQIDPGVGGKVQFLAYDTTGRLVRPEGPRLRLIETYGALSNSSYSVGDYRTYNGADLSESDEDAILAKISGDAVDASGILNVHGFAYRHQTWAVGMRAMGNADAKLPKDLFRLAFDGNELDETFTFDATDGAGELIGEFYASHAREVEIPHAGRVALGASLKWFRGWYYGGIEGTSGWLRTDADGLQGGGDLRARTSTGGNGFGIDLGAWYEVDPSWSVSLAVRNLVSNVWWTRGTEETAVHATVREWTVQDLEDEDDPFESEDETYAVGTFRTSIPTTLTAGTAHRYERWTFAADWTQGFTESLYATRTPRLAIGAEVPATAWIVGRAGISVGGLDRRSFAVGVGLMPGVVRIDFALVARDGYLPFTGRGIGAGLGLAVEF